MTTKSATLPLAGKLYVAAVVLAGAVAVTESFFQILTHPVNFRWALLAALTLISGSATVKLPSVQATISVSETFVFTSVLLFGPAAGTITVALDALVMSFWVARRKSELHRLLFNMAAPPLSIWVASHVFFAVAGIPVSTDQLSTIEIGELILPLFVFTIIYFSLNSWLIAFAIAFEQGGGAVRIWRDNLLWLSLNYFGGASVAALLVGYTRSLNVTILVIIPLLLVLYFTFKTALGRVEDANDHIEKVNRLYLSTIETLAMAIDAKDQITHGHIRRVQIYAVELAKAVGVRDHSMIRAVEAAALLHDMGKLAVPEYILNKPGPLTTAEFEKMKLHASVGADILSAIDFPYPVVPIVRHHHESWDGTGYPAGLKGAEIPLGARILSVVDCFDALTSDRPYRPRLSDGEALRILQQRRGTMYDPLIVDTFVAIQPTVNVAIAPVTHTRTALSAIAEAAAVNQVQAIDSGSRFEDISSSAEEMLALYELARGLTGRLELSDVGDVISKHLRRIVPASWLVFYSYNAECDELVAAHATGDNASLAVGIRVPLGQRLSGWVAANRQTIVNSDPVLDLGEIARSSQPRLRSCLSTPLVSGERLVGVLTLYSAGRSVFTEDHRRIVEVVARQVSSPIAAAIDFERQRAISFRDALTGLPNLEHLREFIGSEISGLKDRVPLSLLLIDIDNLKTINDSHGRPAGDKVLSHVVEATRRSLRGADILFRFGSDEFVALLTHTDAGTAEMIASRIRQAVKAVRIKDLRSDLSVSASIAVATAPEDGANLESLLRSATTRLASEPRGQRSDSIH